MFRILRSRLSAALILNMSLILGTLSPLVAAGTLTIGVEEQAFLPHFHLVDGKLKGYAGEVFDLYAAQSKHQIMFKAMPARELFSALQNGQVDFRYPDNPDWQESLKSSAKHAIFYSENIVRYTEGSLVTKENKDVATDKLKTIGIVRGREPTAYLTLLNKGTVLAKENRDLADLIKNTLLGRVDAAYYNIDVTLYTLHKMGIANDLLFDQNLPSDTNYYRLSTIKHRSVIDEFNQFLQNNQPAIRALKDKYHLQ